MSKKTLSRIPARAGARVVTAKKKPAPAAKKPVPVSKAPKPAPPKPASRPAPPKAGKPAPARPTKADAGITPRTGAKPAGKPVAARPVAARPVAAAKLTTAKPVAARPSTSKPTAAKPTAAKPSATKPSAGKPSATKPSVVAKLPAAKAPAPPGAKPLAKSPALAKAPAPKATAPAKAGKTAPVAAAPTPAPAAVARPPVAKAAKKPPVIPPKPLPKIPPEEMLLERAKRAVTLGDEEQAERLLEKMVVDFPDDPRGRCYLGNLKRRRGDDKGALDEYARVLRRNPAEPTALLLKAELHLAQKPEPDFVSAVAAYKKIVQSLGRKKDDRAKDVVEKAKKQLRFCEARKLSLQSRRHLTSDDARQVKKGREILEKALEAYPEDARNHMNLGVAYLLLDQSERAAELCRAAIDLNPAYARAYLMLGRALTKLKQLRGARDAFLKCIELDRSGRDAQDAWNDRREVERDMAKVRLTLFQALSGRPAADGEKVRLTLGQMKQMVAMLEGDTIDGADLTLDVRGHYALTAYSKRHRYRFFPGPESLVVEHDGLTTA